jgi:bifunctional non-homologous end joining protein LigD
MKIDSYDIELSNQDKVLFPEVNITKGELIDYYKRIGSTMIPLIYDRPITMHRFPDGINKGGFYQQEVPGYFPDWFERVNAEKKEGGNAIRIVCTKTADLVYLANQGCITPHIWLARKEKLNNPDRLVFDLDPPRNKGFKIACHGALALQKILRSLDLVSFVMTTGSRGFHLVVPLKGKPDFDTVRKFARHVADKVSSKNTEEFTTEQRKEKRGDRLYIDVSRNAYGQTAVAPYAIRPLKNAPVATPLAWNELEQGRIASAQQYNLKNIFKRLGQKEDPWAEIESKAVFISKRLKYIEAAAK